MSALIAALTGTISELGLDNGQISRIYGTTNGKLLREEYAYDDESLLLAQADPVLESADFPYGDIRTTKETDAMILNTTANSVEVRVSARPFLCATPSFPQDANAVWKPTTPDALVNWRAVAGRILRFRFTVKDSRLCSFDAWSEGVQITKAEK
jgi:hypothetical protein